jgi:hypothetical protein
LLIHFFAHKFEKNAAATPDHFLLAALHFRLQSGARRTVEVAVARYVFPVTLLLSARLFVRAEP